MRALARWHDALTSASGMAGALCVGAIAASYCFEVVSRYVFAAPTVWVNTVTTYLLLAGVALATPAVSREARHVSITLLTDAASPRIARRLKSAIAVIAGAVCGAAAAVIVSECRAQLRSGVVTIDPLQVPKWWFTALLAYGLASAAVHFFRLALHPAEPGPEAG